MLVGVAFLPLSFSARWNIGILHHKKAKLRNNMRQSVLHTHSSKAIILPLQQVLTGYSSPRYCFVYVLLLK